MGSGKRSRGRNQPIIIVVIILFVRKNTLIHTEIPVAATVPVPSTSARHITFRLACSVLAANRAATPALSTVLEADQIELVNPASVPAQLDRSPVVILTLVEVQLQHVTE
jgi:hypothetical protein